MVAPGSKGLDRRLAARSAIYSAPPAQTKQKGARCGLDRVCRRAAARHGQMFGQASETVDRQGGTTRGAGGDRTLVIDSAAEDVIFAELEALHEQGYDFTAISEERGTSRSGRPPARSGS